MRDGLAGSFGCGIDEFEDMVGELVSCANSAKIEVCVPRHLVSHL